MAKQEIMDDELGSQRKSEGKSSASEQEAMSDAEGKSVYRKRKFINKTYLLRPDTVERVTTIAKQERLQINELARFLFDYALQEVESGRLKIPTTTSRRRIVF